MARLLAALGGAVIFGVAIAVTVSVAMRNLGLQGVRGDFELVEMSCAYAAGLFLPLCQLNRGHVMVDLFTCWLPRSLTDRVDWLWLVFAALIWAVLCHFTLQGLTEVREYGDRTMLLSIPVWWAYAPAALGFAAASAIAFAQAFLPLETGH